MDHLAGIRVTFFQECEEQLAALESGLLAMQSGDGSQETVNAVFRAVHSIKGGAGAFKLAELVAFAHIFETLLDKIRSSDEETEAETVRLLLRAADVLSDLVIDSRDGQPIDPAGYSHLVAELEAAAHSAHPEQAGEDEDGFEAIDFTPAAIMIDEPPQASAYEIRFVPSPELYRKANDPLTIIRELESFGPLHVSCDASALPGLDAFDWKGSYLAFDLRLETAKSEAAVREAFEFVEGDCELSIAAAAEPVTPLAALAEPSLAPLPDQPVPPAAEIAAVEPREAPRQQQASLEAQPRPASQQTIRVDLDRVDRLINLVGELVINQAMLSMRFAQMGVAAESSVSASLEELEFLTRDIQESVMAIRAQPVKSLFQRMSRIVREVAEATGKSVVLKTEGEATEIDKTVIELLADPLTHMIRNAVDHGLERPEQRRGSGKPEEGTVRLSAAHRSGRVVITVADDGAGINRPRVLEIATGKGLVPPGAQLTDTEIDNLLFLPGFSTANSVSSISGRGVGMDVVKRSIQALGGRISISSAPRLGTTFSMSLPLTLAVLDGIVVAIDGQTFVIPLTAVVETLQPEAGMLLAMGQGALALRVRESFVPLIDVGYELGIRHRKPAGASGVIILVETDNRSRVALLADSIQDQRQVVIKSLESNYGKVRGVAAATILGDGRVAMILDVDSLVGSRDTSLQIRDQELAKAS
jgi:two-component system chemotaxis sensor kinase CheA